MIETIWKAKKSCYIPVLNEEENKLYFVRYVYGDALRLNRFSILEPVNASRKIAPENLDIVITPLIAFDLQGHRLGTGGGYYDRTFAYMQEESIRNQFVVGLGYAAQQAESIPSDPWDILLNSVVTEKGVINFRK